VKVAAITRPHSPADASLNGRDLAVGLDLTRRSDRWRGLNHDQPPPLRLRTVRGCFCLEHPPEDMVILPEHGDRHVLPPVGLGRDGCANLGHAYSGRGVADRLAQARERPLVDPELPEEGCRTWFTT
jgi:hypothetical protein